MTDLRDWGDDVHRYLDGEGPKPADDRTRASVESFEDAVRAFTARAGTLGEGLDARIMDAVRRRAGRGRGWRWLVEPRAIRIRPGLAAAAAVILVAVSSGVTMMLGRDGALEGGATAAPALTGGTVLVRFELLAPEAHRVTLAGSFNEWNDSSIVFTPTAQAGVWSVTVALSPGQYQYLFVVDGDRWIPDPEAHAQVEDAFGQKNSLLVVGPRGVVRS